MIEQTCVSDENSGCVPSAVSVRFLSGLFWLLTAGFSSMTDMKDAKTGLWSDVRREGSES